MSSIRAILPFLALTGCLIASGCITSAPDSSDFAQVNTAVVDAPFEEAWQTTKAVLREHEMLIYTRDKRGIFVAYTDSQRRLFVPGRTQFTINLEEVTPDSTRITVETLFQQYGVTLLTFPGWHDRPTEDNAQALAILDEIASKVAAEEPAEPA